MIFEMANSVLKNCVTNKFYQLDCHLDEIDLLSHCINLLSDLLNLFVGVVELR